jgi:putative hemolysin
MRPCNSVSVDPPTRSGGQREHIGTSSSKTTFTVKWANCEADVCSAQQLRYQVFIVEMGAVPNHEFSLLNEQREGDRFDSFCDHLLIYAPAPISFSSDQSALTGPLIGTCRVLRPEQAQRAGGLYCETEFDLGPLAPLRGDTLELGRTCVHPDWRSGSVVLAMWRALGQFMTTYRLQTMIGCASVWLGDDGALAGSIWEQLRSTHLVEPRWQIQPRTPMLLPVCASNHLPAAHDTAQSAATNVVCSVDHARVPIPALIKGYLRCGARLLGPPARDVAFNTADLPMIMHFGEITSRYRKHFLEPRSQR